MNIVMTLVIYLHFNPISEYSTIYCRSAIIIIIVIVVFVVVSHNYKIDSFLTLNASSSSTFSQTKHCHRGDC